MAETFAKNLSDGNFFVESTGLNPLPVHPLTIDVMKEIGIDIFLSVSKAIHMKHFMASNIISKIGDQSSEKSPLIPYGIYNKQWDIVNPVTDHESEAKIVDFRLIRDEIHKNVRSLLQDFRII